MPRSMPHVASATDLVTTLEARRDGFLEIVLRRSSESLPYVEQGKVLWNTLSSKTRKCEDILGVTDIRPSLLLAAGCSAKAQLNMEKEDGDRVLNKFIEQVLRPSGRKYIDEIVYRYLLGLGEQLGGRMRNVIGVVAREKLSRRIIAQLRVKNLEFAVHCGSGKWVSGADCTIRDEAAAKAIKWTNGDYQRMLVHNVNVPDVSKNVDMVVFNKFADKIDKKSLDAILADQKNYVVMGELKGGIDPAGADEHWKTARAALDRIRATFKKVYIAFVGGAIEKAMAEEIYTQFQSGLLDYAANLTNDSQLSSFCDWLVNQ